MAAAVYYTPSVVVGGLLALVGHIQAHETRGLLMTVAIKVLVYQISRILYNVFLHPLAKFPGPLLRSGLYIFNYWEELRGVQAKKALALHNRYGPVVRIGPDSLSFNTANAWKDIYNVKPGKPEIPKDSAFFTQNTKKVPSILVCNHEDHVRIKRLVAHAFSDSALRNQESLMTKYIELLISQLKKKVSAGQGKQDILSWYMFTTFDIMSDLCFAEPMDALANGAYQPWIVTILNAAKNGSYVRLERAYPLLAGISHLYKKMFSGPSKLNTSRAEHMRYSIQKTESRMDSDMERNDIMTPMLQHNSEKGMSRAEIAQTLILFMTGGTEPTASGMSGVTYNVLGNQRVYTRLVKEVRENFSSDAEVNNVAVNKLPYLNACIKESLRLYPPVPARFPRRTVGGQVVIDGKVIPANTSIGVHQWAAYHSAANFHEPNSYFPERWLDDAPSEFKNDALTVVQPFSTGPRICIGKNMAWLQMRSILCRLVLNFEMELCEESQSWNDQKARLLWEMPPLHVKLSHRET